ncbi:MAG: hypothetical protein II381_01225, partial [Victivallales bacterium]|nr:hypothetical protein [Victivallales bacterium]
DFLELLDELSYRMTSFAAAQRMTTAEQTEAFQIFSNSRYHVCSKSSAPWPTSARHFGVFCVFCGS